MPFWNTDKNKKRWTKIEKTINWKRFNDQYVRLQRGVEKRLRLKNWQGGEFFDKPGISFDVLQEDGEQVSKQFTVTSRRLIRQLKPILLKTEEAGKKEIAVAILRTGEGMATRYRVQELTPSFKELFKEK